MRNIKPKQCNTSPRPKAQLTPQGLRAFQELIGYGVAAMARVGAQLAVCGLEDRLACGRLRLLDRWTLEVLAEEAAKQKKPGYAEAAKFIRGLIPEA